MQRLVYRHRVLLNSARSQILAKVYILRSFPNSATDFEFLSRPYLCFRNILDRRTIENVAENISSTEVTRINEDSFVFSSNLESLSKLKNKKVRLGVRNDPKNG